MTTPVPEPPAPAPPAAPAHEGLLERAAGIFHHGDPVPPAVAGDVKLLLRGHSAALIHAAAEIIDAGWPGAEPVASKVLEVALGVANAAGIVL
ncbi:MAG TPA: hypothetical protein VGS06_46300 [Streptosporangiaceae bacterium]|nr:hypothetical protein [Streptosporangiaceae bacterium]